MSVRLLSILIILCSSIKAQEIELIEFNTYKNYYKNCDVIPSCIDFILFYKDTLQLSFTSMNLHYKIQPQFSYMVKNDTLEIKYYPPEIIKDTIIYNKDKRKYEKVKYYCLISAPIRFAEDKSCITFLLKFNGIQNIPNHIIYNGGLLTNCPSTIIDYKLYKGDTINLIDENGFKDGIWIDFYDTGEIMKRKVYKHGRYIEGFQYDKNGNKTHALSESCEKTLVPNSFK
jgi:hypothetical protein